MKSILKKVFLPSRVMLKNCFLITDKNGKVLIMMSKKN